MNSIESILSMAESKAMDDVLTAQMNHEKFMRNIEFPDQRTNKMSNSDREEFELAFSTTGLFQCLSQFYEEERDTWVRSESNPDAYEDNELQAAWIGWQTAKTFGGSSMPYIPEVKRIEDMSAKGYLKVMRDGDGDVIVAVHGMCGGVVQHCEAVEFCVGRGGNRSPNTVKALIQLAAAMQKDNLENPIRS